MPEGVLHVFLRVFTKEEGHLLTGFLFLENVRIDAFPLAGSAVPFFQLGLKTGEGTSWLRLTEGPNGHLPWFMTTMPLDEASQLVFNDTKRYIPLEAALRSASPWKPTGSSIRQVLSTSFGLLAEDDAMFLNVVTRQIDYHARLGISSTIMYCRPKLCEKYGRNAAIAGLISTGKLELVPFDEIGLVQGRPYYDQSVQYNHAILSNKDRGSYLFMADLDEYLAFDSPADARSLACLGLESGCAAVPRFRVFPEREIPSLAYGDFIPALTKWDGREASTKSIIDPNRMTRFFVHQGGVCVQADETGCLVAAACNAVQPSCARVAHFSNMLKKREKVEVFNTTDSDAWLWPFQGGSLSNNDT
ncbi:hypothetical protein Rsub_06896 [Raphidocelis subcapitata]|uniref:Uncharacterized protein n=1 Tax=Raphidocelis subcapitata TaxID=307507 RepID=A0A2V0P9Q3_9CHLO|nr:hypothetical protein Rsub_06896 [Raphidocelis subcapitata]|eukprot:GBF93897.1 hypothetical protein Rsub_06896 [Raphidocelis subcapitata]